MRPLLLLQAAIAILLLAILIIEYQLGIVNLIYHNRLRFFLRRKRIKLLKAIREIMSTTGDAGIRFTTLEASLSKKDRKILYQLLFDNLQRYPEKKEFILRILHDNGWAKSNLKKAKSRSWIKRIEAAKTLEKFAGDREIALLIKLLEDKREEVRLIAANCLANFGEFYVLQAIVNAIRNGKLGKSRRLLYILTLIAAKDVSLLLPLLDHPRKAIQIVALEALIGAERQEMAKCLLPFIESEDIDLKATAIKGLGQLKYIEALPRLLILVNDKNWQIRACVAKALGELGKSEAVPKLLSNLLLDDSYWVRRNAAKSLLKLGRHGQSALAQAAVIGNSEAQQMANFTLKELIWDESITEGNYYISDDGLVYMTKDQFEKIIVEKMLGNE